MKFKIFFILIGLFFNTQYSFANLSNYSEVLSCKLLKFPENKVLDKVEVLLGPHGEDITRTLLDSEDHLVYAYVDVQPLGYKGNYNSNLNIAIGLQPEDAGPPLLTKESLVSAGNPKINDGDLISNIDLNLNNKRYSIECRLILDYYED